MKVVYPIIIYPSESGETGRYVDIPDIDRGTQGGKPCGLHGYGAGRSEPVGGHRNGGRSRSAAAV